MSVAVVAQEGGYNYPIEQEEERFIRQRLLEILWSDTSLYDTALPAEFNDQEAVILLQTVSREYYRNTRNTLRTILLEHNVIRMLSESAVRKYTVFTMEKAGNPGTLNVTAVRIVKPDGRIINLNLDSVKAVQPAADDGRIRFALPGLETGDALDYYSYTESRSLFPQAYSRIFDPVYWINDSEYPVLHRGIHFTLGPSAFLNVLTNRFPEARTSDVKVDQMTFRRLSWNLYDLPAHKEVPFAWPFRDQPSMKYQVFVGPYLGNADVRYNLGGSLKVNSTVNRSRLQDHMEFLLMPGRDYHRYFKEFCRYLRSTGYKPNRLGKVEAARMLAEFLRMDQMLSLALPDRRPPPDMLSSAHYILDKLDVGHKVWLTFDRSSASADSFLLTDEIYPVIRISRPGAVFMPSAESMGEWASMPPRMEANTAWIYDPKTGGLDTTYIPASSAKDNVIAREWIWIPEENGASTFRIKGSATGYQRARAEGLYGRPYLGLMYGSYLTHRFGSGAVYYSDILEAKARQREIELSEAAINRMKSEFGIPISDYQVSVEPVAAGQDVFRWSESFSAAGALVHSAGDLMVDLSLLGEKADLPDTTGRTARVFIDFRKEQEVTIRIRIPEGREAHWSDPPDRNVRNGAGTAYGEIYREGEDVVVRAGYRLEHSDLPPEAIRELYDLLETYNRSVTRKILLTLH